MEFLHFVFNRDGATFWNNVHRLGRARGSLHGFPGASVFHLSLSDVNFQITTTGMPPNVCLLPGPMPRGLYLALYMEFDDDM
eukprot:9508583-Karenia_brevis.AAC.1